MEKNIFKRVASLALAVVMMLSVLVVVNPQEAKAAERTMTGKKWNVTISDAECFGGTLVTGETYGTNQIYYIKFKAPSTGYVTFTATPVTDLIPPFSAGSWRLYDSKKKALSSEDGLDTRDSRQKIVYGVTKNKTYYLGVKVDAGTKISAAFSKVNEKSGKTKNKAVNMKRNKKVVGVVSASSKKETDWYKFTLDKTRYVSVSFSAKTNNAIKVTFYEGKRKLAAEDLSRFNPDWGGSMVREGTSTKIKVAKGTTFYVRVDKKSNGSGTYTLKWK